MSKVILDYINIVFTFLCFVIGPEKTHTTFSTNQIKTETKCDLVARVFPRFKHFACFYVEFSLALVIFISSDCDIFGFGC